MSKAMLVSRVKDKLEGSVTVDAVVDAVFEVLRELGDAERVAIRKLGVFTMGSRAARMGRNPKTGAPVEIPAHRVLKFRCRLGD